MIKLLHGADFHLDSPFDALPEEKAAQRRQEQRELLDRLADLANAEQVDAVLLSGDLLDSNKSYYETGEALMAAFEKIKTPVFIAPGNHDYYHRYSPWAVLNLPEHVHVFKSTQPEAVELPDKGVVIWGAAFVSAASPGLLAEFPPIEDRSKIHVMALHGQLGAEGAYNPYNHITEHQIAATGLHYLALGHHHSYPGLMQSGDTYYTYSGAPEGRGFDEMGPKGVLLVEVDQHKTTTRFIELGSRQYHKLQADLTDKLDVLAAVTAALPQGTERDIYRIALTGEYDGKLELDALTKALADRFFYLEIRDHTRIRRDIWTQAEEDTLRGLFLRKMRSRYEAGDETEREKIVLAVRYALAAIDQGEQWRV
ncbi:MAG: DNA repair exonuclease [Oscillospiraceae bacterium]|nr:DNA repair exonuclease [Oscillospiraceae bacterium]